MKKLKASIIEKIDKKQPSNGLWKISRPTRRQDAGNVDADLLC